MATEANLQRLRQSQRLYLCATPPRRGASALASHSQPGLDHRPHHARPRADHRGPGVAGPPDPCPARCRNVGCYAASAGCAVSRNNKCTWLASDKARQRLMKLQAQVVAGTFTTKAVILAKAKKARSAARTICAASSPSRCNARRPARNCWSTENVAAIQDETDLQGVYLLRSTATELADDELWHTYMLLTRVEAAFRNLKTDLNLRPIFHHKEDRGDAHVLFAVLAYALSVTIHLRHRQHGPNLTTTALAGSSASDRVGRTVVPDNRWRTAQRFERAAVPTATQQAILQALDWTIPDRYLPPNLEAEPRRVV